MRHKLRRRRPSPALVVSIVALVMATAGTGYAAGVLARNSVGATQLKRNAVSSSKIKDRSISARDLSAATRKTLAGPAGATGANVTTTRASPRHQVAAPPRSRGLPSFR